MLKVEQVEHGTTRVLIEGQVKDILAEYGLLTDSMFMNLFKRIGIENSREIMNFILNKSFKLI